MFIEPTTDQRTVYILGERPKGRPKHVKVQRVTQKDVDDTLAELARRHGLNHDPMAGRPADERWNTFEHKVGGLFSSFFKYAVLAESASDFIDRYYKPDRVRGLRAELIASRVKDLEENGYTIISHYDSRTGDVVSFYGPA